MSNKPTLQSQKFAKVFDTPSGQILIKLDYNQAKDAHEIIYEMDFGFLVSLSLTPAKAPDDHGEKAIREIFDKIEQRQADGLAANVVKILSKV